MKGNNNSKKKLKPEEKIKLLSILKFRFEKNIERHKAIEWNEVEKQLESSPEKLWSLNEMEKTGGEPDVVILNKKKREFVYCDCSAETPNERRNLCYDSEALQSRKSLKPKSNVIDMAVAMGIELLEEEEYLQLQQSGDFDCKTSSWIKTPQTVRKLGGALFGDNRFGRIFIYHNGASSYFSGRGFRGKLIL